MRQHDRVTLTAAYVLHQRDWRETSRIIEIFSREYGRLGMVARGLRRAKSTWRPVLRPFQPLLLSWVGSGDLPTLVNAESTRPSQPLTGDVLMSGYYMNELLLRLMPRHDSQPELYDQYEIALGQLMLLPAPALRIFEKHLLQTLGYGLNLEREADTGKPIDSETGYYYVPDHGPECAQNESTPGLPISGETLLALARGELRSPEQLRDSRRLLHDAISRLLGNKPLKTKAVMQSLHKPWN